MKRLFIFLLFLSGCSRGYLYVQRENVDAEYLASFHVNTPDPQKENPPRGQMIHVFWKIPRTLLDKNLSLFLTARFRNNEQEVIYYPLSIRKGFKSFFFSNPENMHEKKLLTYKVQLMKEGKVIDTWKHQLWVELIDLKD